VWKRLIKGEGKRSHRKNGGKGDSKGIGEEERKRGMKRKAAREGRK
jgi:hypothetical protein